MSDLIEAIIRSLFDGILSRDRSGCIGWTVILALGVFVCWVLW